MTPAERAAAEKVDANRTVPRESALIGAQSVAEAVKRVADAAVAEVSKTSVGPQPELTFVGTAGGGFTIRGVGFGTSGTVTVNGVQVRTNGWGDMRIEGTLPAEAQSGEVVVHVDDKTTRTGRFVRPAA